MISFVQAGLWAAAGPCSATPGCTVALAAGGRCVRCWCTAAAALLLRGGLCTWRWLMALEGIAGAVPAELGCLGCKLAAAARSGPPVPALTLPHAPVLQVVATAASDDAAEQLRQENERLRQARSPAAAPGAVSTLEQTAVPVPPLAAALGGDPACLVPALQAMAARLNALSPEKRTALIEQHNRLRDAAKATGVEIPPLAEEASG